jgi:hypothetical protein
MESEIILRMLFGEHGATCGRHEILSIYAPQLEPS